MARGLFYLFLISLPFGTRFLVYQFTTGFHEYESIFVYASDILLVLFLVFAFGRRGTFEKTVSQAERAGYPTVLTRQHSGVSEAESERSEHAGVGHSVFSRKFPEGTKSHFIFLFFAAISILLAFSKGLAIYNFVRLLLLVCMAFAVGKIIKERVVKLENIFAIIAGSAVFQSLIGVFQFIKQSSLGLGFLGESALGPDIGGAAKIVVEGGKILRAYGTFPHPNVLAAFLILGLMSLYYFWMKSTNNESVTNKRIYKFLLPIAIFIISLGLLFAFSRAGWLIAGFATLASITTALFNKDYFRQAVRLAILMIAIIGILVLGFQSYIFPRAQISLSEPSVSYRLEYNKLALELIQKNPLGVGIGNQVLYSVKNVIYQKFGMDQVWQWQPVHNIYLLVASEIGIFGLISLLVFIASLFLNPKHEARNPKQYQNSNDQNSKRLGFRIWNLFRISNFEFRISTIMLAALLLFGLVDHFLWTLQPGRLMLWLIIGLIWGLTSSNTLYYNGKHESNN